MRHVALFRILHSPDSCENSTRIQFLRLAIFGWQIEIYVFETGLCPLVLPLDDIYSDHFLGALTGEQISWDVGGQESSTVNAEAQLVYLKLKLTAE